MQTEKTEGAPLTGGPVDRSVRTRTLEQLAIEHAEHMATGAEHMLDALELLNELNDEDRDEEATIDEIMDAEMRLHEAIRGLRSDIYEFRKRAERTTSNL